MPRTGIVCMTPDTAIITTMTVMKKFITTGGSWRHAGLIVTSGNCTTTTGGNTGSGGTSVTIIPIATKSADSFAKRAMNNSGSWRHELEPSRPVSYLAERQGCRSEFRNVVVIHFDCFHDWHIHEGILLFDKIVFD